MTGQPLGVVAQRKPCTAKVFREEFKREPAAKLEVILNTIDPKHQTLH